MNFYCVTSTIVGNAPDVAWRTFWSDLHDATPAQQNDWAKHLRRRLTKIVWVTP
jgi:hypothetical protein